MPDKPPLGKRAAKRKREIAQQVCAAAEARLARGESVAALSIEQLVTDAGVPRSTFYVYFHDKAEVFREILEGFVAFTVETIVSASDPQATSRTQLAAALAAGVQHYAANRDTYRLLADAAVADATTAASYRQATDRVIEALARVVARWRGSTRPAQRDRALAASLVWMVERTLYQEAGPHSARSQPALVEALTTVIWRVAEAERSGPSRQD